MKIGTIIMDWSLINKHPQQVCRVFFAIKFCPTRAEPLLPENLIRYTGVSEFFADIPRNIVPPYYTLETRVENDVIVAVKIIQDQYYPIPLSISVPDFPQIKVETVIPNLTLPMPESDENPI